MRDRDRPRPATHVTGQRLATRSGHPDDQTSSRLEVSSEADEPELVVPSRVLSVVASTVSMLVPATPELSSCAVVESGPGVPLVVSEVAPSVDEPAGEDDRHAASKTPSDTKARRRIGQQVSTRWTTPCGPYHSTGTALPPARLRPRPRSPFVAQLVMIAPLSILLPGLDGTAALFEPFVAAAPPAFPVQPLPLPNDRPRSYRELADWVRTRVPLEPFALIAESFSGPLALLVADRCPQVTAVVLCASFVDAPLPSLLARLPSFVWHRLPPTALIRLFLTGGDRALAAAVRAVTATVPADVIAHRIAAVLRTDVAAELERLTRPLLLLRAQQDRVIPSRSFDRARTLKPSARFAEIRSPHLLLQTHPDDAWGHIGPFLEEASACRAECGPR